MGRQFGWYVNVAGTLIGAIALTPVGRSWNFAVLRRNRLGAFAVRNVGDNFFNLQQMMVQFHHAVAAVEHGPPDLPLRAE